MPESHEPIRISKEEASFRRLLTEKQNSFMLSKKDQKKLKKRHQPVFLNKIARENILINGKMQADLTDKYKSQGEEQYQKVYKKNWYKPWYRRWRITKRFFKEVDNREVEEAHKQKRRLDYTLHKLGLLYNQLIKDEKIGTLHHVKAKEQKFSEIKENIENKEYYFRLFRYRIFKPIHSFFKDKKIKSLNRKIESEKSLGDKLYEIELKRFKLIVKITDNIHEVNAEISKLRKDSGSLNNHKVLDSTVAKTIKTMIKKDIEYYDGKFLPGSEMQRDRIAKTIEKVISSKSRDNRNAASSTPPTELGQKLKSSKGWRTRKGKGSASKQRRVRRA